MEVYKIGSATVRIHGAVNQERLKEAAVDFLKKVDLNRMKAGAEQSENSKSK